MKKSACRVQTLAEDGLCTVQFCAKCKVFHLNIGYATVHIHPEAFATMRGTINTALARFQGQTPPADAGQFPETPEITGSLH